jgi:hydroxymethylpyrimidine pyrophosphatase-like HAD family hydrolase
MRVAFDVDGTLVHDGNPAFKFLSPTSGVEEPLCDTPRYDVIAMFHAYQTLGFEMFIWSGGGVEYAKHWAAKLGLSATVVEKGSFRPDIAVDDCDVKLGIANIRV